VTLVLLLGLAAYQSDIFQTLASRIEATRIGSNDRLGTALLGLRIFKSSPYFGMGYNSFSYLFSRRFTNSLHEVLFAQTSTIVQMLSDGGLLLFLGYIAFVIAATRGGIALMKQSKTTVHSGVINGVAAWLIVMLWVNQSATWFIVGSYFGPLVLGFAGIVSGCFARFLLLRAHEESLASRLPS
jgi:O-antigen ligase